MKKENIEDKIVLILNASEISQIITCLDFYSRIWIGQYLEIDNEMLWIKEDISRSDSEIAVTPFFRDIRKRILPKLEESLHSSYGIFSYDMINDLYIQYLINQQNISLNHPEYFFLKQQINHHSKDTHFLMDLLNIHHT